MRTIALGDICFIEKGKIGIQAATPGKYPLVTTGAEFNSHNEYHFEGEAVCIPLVSGTGHGHASIKRVHYVNGKFCVGNILAACLPKDKNKTSANFLFLYFSLLKDSVLVPLMQGSANVSLKIKDLQKVHVPDISLATQLEIVSQFKKLELHQKQIVEEIDNQQQYLQQLRQAILQEAVQGKLVSQDFNDEPAGELLKRIKAEKEKLIKAGKLKKEKPLPPITADEIPFELPKGWEWCRFNALELRSNTGLERDKSRQGTTLQFEYLKMNNIGNNGECYITDLTRVDASKEEILKYSLKKGDFLFNTRNSRELVGKTCVYPGKEGVVLYNNNILRVEFIFISPIFINFYFCSVEGRKCLRNLVTSTTNVAAIYQKQLAEFLIPVPPINEQNRIIVKVEQLMKYCDELEQQINQSKADAEQLLQTVLREAFKGGKTYAIDEPEESIAAEP